MLLRRILYWSNYLVIRWQLILFGLLILAIWYVLKKDFQRPEYLHWEEMMYFLRFFFWSAIVLTFLSFFSVVAAWAFFYFVTRKQNPKTEIGFGDGGKAQAGLVPVTVKMYGVLRPLLGSVRVRLVFSGMKISPPFSLNENITDKGSLVRKGISGTGRVELYDRGIYDIEEIQIFFCDMLRLLSLPVTAHTVQQLYTLPKEQEKTELRTFPNTTEEQKHRIEIPKRVEGEYLNYKDFESGDDVRRIVWKIFARNGELVVRIPETMDPYASHLYFYASFFSSMDTKEDPFAGELLNSYKDRVRNLFEALERNGFDMRLPHDQETPKLQGMGDKKNELFHIASASWQDYSAPNEFVNARKAAFVCLSSMTSASEVGRLLSSLPMHVPVVAVRLSEGIRSPFRFRIREIFFAPERTPADKLRRPWLIAPLRMRLKKNEEEIDRMFRMRGNAWFVSPEGKL